MADRKQFLNVKAADARLLEALNATRNVVVSEEQLQEQRISFAYGNAMGSESTTKDSVRLSAQYMNFANRPSAEAEKYWRRVCKREATSTPEVHAVIRFYW